MRIAVEDSLTNVKSLLEREGYEIDSLDKNRQRLNMYDAIIISGQDDNMMGITRTLTEVPVIDATGKTPDEVYSQLKDFLR